MAKFARSKQLYAGAIVHIALEVASTSDVATKPAADNAAWQEIGLVANLQHFPLTFSQEYMEITPDGARQRRFTRNIGDRHELTFRETNALFERLVQGLAAAIVEGTAQSPGVAEDRMLRAWVKIQTRMSDGNDNSIEDRWCEIRPLDPPAVTPDVQVPGFELWTLGSALNATVYPDNS